MPVSLRRKFIRTTLEGNHLCNISPQQQEGKPYSD